MAGIKDTTLFCASNLTYFYDHGYSFAKSAYDVGYNSRIVIFKDSPDQDQREYLLFMTKFYQNIDPKKCVVQMLSHNTISEFRKNLYIEDDRSFYASIRLLMLENIVIENYENLNSDTLMLDMDTIIRKKIQLKKNKIGIFLRNEEDSSENYEVDGMRVAAGMLHVNINSLDFINSVRTHLVNYPIRWFADQHALYHGYVSYKDEIDFYNLNKNQLDWDFEEGTSTWTGKGARKVKSEVYLTAKKSIDDKFGVS